ncbi:MAG: hypothetical protein WBO36_09100 [Saprospiraceae bacterium]
MSTGYQINNKAGSYFLTFQFVDWVDQPAGWQTDLPDSQQAGIFTWKVYRDIILESFDFVRRNKGRQLWAYLVMSNHTHCILSAENGTLPAIIRDFKLKDIERNKTIK